MIGVRKASAIKFTTKNIPAFLRDHGLDLCPIYNPSVRLKFHKVDATVAIPAETRNRYAVYRLQEQE